MQVDSPCKIKNICHNALCNRALNRAESTGNCNAVLLAEININRIVTDSSAGNDFKFFAFGYCFITYFFGTAYNCVGVKHKRTYILLVRAAAYVLFAVILNLKACILQHLQCCFVICRKISCRNNNLHFALSFCVVPALAAMHICGELYLHLTCIFHLFTDDFLNLYLLILRSFDNQFVMDLHDKL